MTPNSRGTIDQLWAAACCRLPSLTPAEQRAGLVLLRELSRGAPVEIDQLARVLTEPLDATERLVKRSRLSAFVHADEGGRIQGFWGLSVVPTNHRITVEGRELWTWCAYDSLFIPELLGSSAIVESRDPDTALPISLNVSPTRIEAAKPVGVVMSMMNPTAWDTASAARVMASACHFIFFFVSRASAERWRAEHPQTVLLSLEDAFSLARRYNAHLFGTELGRRRNGSTQRSARVMAADSRRN